MAKLALLLEGPHHRRMLAGVLLLGLALRVGWILAVEVDPRSEFHFDMTFYELAALRLTDGALLRDFDGTPTAKWSPGYPLLLGAAYLAFGKHLIVGKLLNALLATISAWLCYRLGSRLFRPAVGLLGAALFALLPGDVFYAALHLSEVAFTTLFTCALWWFVLLEERRPEPLFPGWFAYGMWIGAAILVRGTAGLYLAVPVVIFWLSRSFGAAFRLGAVASAGVIVVVAPWTLRNLAVLGEPVIVSTQQVGMAMTFAHSEAADGGYSQRLVVFRDGLVAPFAHLPNPERELAEWRFEMRRAFDWALAHPGREIALVPRRFMKLYAHDHAALPWVTPKPAPGRMKPAIFGPARDRALSLAADWSFYALLALALVALPRSLTRRRPAAWILAGSLAYVTLLHGVLFAGDPRFHAPLAPLLALLAAATLLRAEVAPFPADAGALSSTPDDPVHPDQRPPETP
jgi:hypothetical protein